MFVKLTRIDGRPVWVNGIFVVTVEPARGTGSLVVPMGDGMDYEVRESPETVLALLQGAPEPAVIAVPAPTGLTHLPPDAVPDDPGDLVRGGGSAEVAVPERASAAAAADEPPKRKRATRKTAVKTAGDKAAAKPAKTAAKRVSARRKAVETEPAAEVAAAPEAAVEAAPAPSTVPEAASVPASALPPVTTVPADDLVTVCAEQAKRSGCRTENRMINFLRSTNRRVSEEEIRAAVAQMKERGLILVDAQGRLTFQ